MEKAMGMRVKSMTAPVEEPEDLEVMAMVRQNRKVSCDDLVMVMTVDIGMGKEHEGFQFSWDESSLALVNKDSVRLLTDEEDRAEKKKKREDVAIRCAAGLGLLMIIAGAAGLIFRTGNPGVSLAMIETALVSFVGYGMKGVIG